ncbi:MAG: DUF1007 family protein [Bacteroidales bacterium]|nr:DUF1007 family protein [Bacteroidales bacterium]
MNMIKILLIFGIIFISTKVKSHPHVFVDVDIAIEFNEYGFKTLYVSFYFDNMFSENLKHSFDINNNDVFDTDEIEQIRLNAFSNLVNYNFFIHLFNKNKEMKFNKADNFKAIIKDELVIYSFSLNLNLPISNNTESFKIACYDDSYYIDALINKENVKFINTKEYTYSYMIEEDKTQAYYYEQLYPESIFLSAKKEQ